MTMELAIGGTVGAIFLAFVFVYSRRIHESASRLLKRNGEKSYVYFMADGDSDEIKIGRSVDPESRLEQFKTAEPEIRMIAYYPETKSFNETILHRRLKRDRRRGEWFKATKEIWRIAETGRL